MSKRDEILLKLCQAPPSQIDPAMARQLLDLVRAETSVVKDKLLPIIDKCAFYGLASDFVMRLLHTLWLQCGGTAEELRTRQVPETPPEYP